MVRSRYVVANDLSPAAVDAIKRNVELNGVGVDASGSSGASENSESNPEQGRVKVNEGDAWYVVPLILLFQLFIIFLNC